MRKYFLGIIIIMLLTIPACQKIFEETELEPNTSEVQLVKSDLARETSSNIDSDQILTLAADNTGFAFALYEQIHAASESKDNFIFSPFSLSLALSMTLAGAESETEKGMLQALHMSLPEKEIYPTFNALLLEIERSQEMVKKGSEGSKFQMNIANSIWGQSGYNFEPDFLDTLARYYGAGLYNVDFIANPEGARKVINAWVEDETQEKILNLIPEGVITNLTRLVLANAMYFNGSWLYSFDHANTSQQPFYLLDGSTIPIDMMKLSGKSLAYYQNENFQAVNLPYLSSDFNMEIFVPNQASFKNFEKEFSPELLAEIHDQMQYLTLELSMPKFDFDSCLNANDALIALGMDEAYDGLKADFSGINNDDELMITDVLQKTTITVDEEGTEAAAATAVIVGIRSLPSEPISLVINRPFYFLITHKPTNTILFMGKVVQP